MHCCADAIWQGRGNHKTVQINKLGRSTHTATDLDSGAMDRTYFVKAEWLSEASSTWNEQTFPLILSARAH